jgi:AraC-like DNA-binding protein
VTILLDISLRSAGLAFGLVLVLVIGMRGSWRQRVDVLVLVACVGAYLACGASSASCATSPAALPLLVGALAFPFALWRLARVVLADRARIPAVAWGALALLLGSGVSAGAGYLQLGADGRAVSAVLNKAIAFGFVGSALYTVWRSWDDDLVEPRRRLRWRLLAFLGAYGVVILVAEVYLFGRHAPAWLEATNVAAIDLTLLAALLFIAAPRNEAMDVLFASARKAAPAPTAGADEALVGRLRTLMESDNAYRDPELSVASLAARLGVPEYVLRRLIHEQLGHRNFAAFVNDYRLREVSRQLGDNACDRLPILTLALEAGFGSIGPFNRAFRDKYGMTPTQFRSQRSSQSFQ